MNSVLLVAVAVIVLAACYAVPRPVCTFRGVSYAIGERLPITNNISCICVEHRGGARMNCDYNRYDARSSADFPSDNTTANNHTTS